MNKLLILATLALSTIGVHAQTVIHANAFQGQDMCVQLSNSLVWAKQSGQSVVDATSYSGTQECSLSPLTGHSNVAVLLGGVTIQTKVPWLINGSGISLIGAGSFQTKLEYTGAAQISGALITDGAVNGRVTNGLIGVTISGISIFGDEANLVDAVVLQDVSRSKFSDIRTWGATSCGFHTEGTVTDSFTDIKVSSTDASVFLTPGQHSQPMHGLCIDKSYVSGNQTTNSTFIDAAAEGVSEYGWYIISAQTTTWTSGTSEANKYGIVVQPNMQSKWNTFIGADVEGNSAGLSGTDVWDFGEANVYISLIAASPVCHGCSSVNWGGSGGQIFTGGYQPSGIAQYE